MSLTNEMQQRASQQMWKHREATHEKEAVSRNGGFKESFSFTVNEEEQVKKALRRPRSKEYLNALKMHDLLSATDEKVIAEILENIDEEVLEEYAEFSAEELLEKIKETFQAEFERLAADVNKIPRPKEVLCKCFIDGCDIHSIDARGNIIAHYERTRKLDDYLEKARRAYHRYHPSYVEVFDETINLVMEDGTVKEYTE